MTIEWIRIVISPPSGPSELISTLYTTSGSPERGYQSVLTTSENDTVNTVIYHCIATAHNYSSTSNDTAMIIIKVTPGLFIVSGTSIFTIPSAENSTAAVTTYFTYTIANTVSSKTTTSISSTNVTPSTVSSTSITTMLNASSTEDIQAAVTKLQLLLIARTLPLLYITLPAAVKTSTQNKLQMVLLIVPKLVPSVRPLPLLVPGLRPLPLLVPGLKRLPLVVPGLRPLPLLVPGLRPLPLLVPGLRPLPLVVQAVTLLVV